MSKSTKSKKSEKQPGVDMARIEQLVDRCLNSEYALPWYMPDNFESLPWEEIVGAFQGGYNFALDAVLRALRGDGGQRLRELLDREIIIIRPADRAECQAKIAQGLTPIHVSTREEAEEFLKQLKMNFAASTPSNLPN
jgi:hypothetical protein